MFYLQMIFIKIIIILAIPIAGFNLTTVLGTLAIGLMMAKLGSDSLAAGAIIGSTQTLLMMIGCSPLFAISSIVSRLNSSKKPYEIGCYVQQGYILSGLLSIPILIGMFYIKPILLLLGQNEHLSNLVDLYFRGYSWGVPAGMILTCSQQFLLGLKRTRVVSITGFIGLFMSVFFGYILAFGKMGVSAYGLAGLGYAQSLRTIITIIILLTFFHFNLDLKKYSLFFKRPFNRFQELKQVLKLGWPISVHAASEYFSVFVLTLIIGRLGQSALIAQQIAGQYNQLLSIIVLAISQSANLLVGNCIGNGKWFNVRLYTYAALSVAFITGLFAIICACFFAEQMVEPYINNSANIYSSNLKTFLIIMMVVQLLNAEKAVFVNILRAWYDTKLPMIFSLICSWFITIPLAGFFVFSSPSSGIDSIAISQIIGSIFSCMFLVYRSTFLYSSSSGQYSKIVDYISRVSAFFMKKRLPAGA